MTVRRVLILSILALLFLSCESKLYPPTYPPELSNLTLTSSSYKSATTTIIEGDTLFARIEVEDPEDDPYTLEIVVLLAGTEIISTTVGESRIYDNEAWEFWVDSSGWALGTYTIQLTPIDKDGNVGDVFTSTFDVTVNNKGTVTVADLTLSAVSYEFRETFLIDPGPPVIEHDEPFRIFFTVSNNSSVDIDQVHVPFQFTYDDSVTGAVGLVLNIIGTVTNIPAGGYVDGIARELFIENNTSNHNLSDDFASSTIVIY